MPISEASDSDHYDLEPYQHHSNSNLPPHLHSTSHDSAANIANRMMSKAELRKTHKPIMEKRRRAKINNCLNEIKDLILAAMKKDPERHSKLEKADILEMAVKHLKTMQKQQKEFALRTDPTVAMKYKSGYLECASDVSSFVDQFDGIDAGLKQRLCNHLNKCANGMENPHFAQGQIQGQGHQGALTSQNFTSSSLLASFAAQSRFNDDQNNNFGNLGNLGNLDTLKNLKNLDTLKNLQGIELIPSCLPNGDFAFLVPKASFSSISQNLEKLENLHKLEDFPKLENFVKLKNLEKPENEKPERPSAFVTVLPRGVRPLSPPASPPEGQKVAVIKPRAEKPAAAAKIQHIKFPINHPINNSAAALSIITNTGERFRQAQRVEEGKNQEENRFQLDLTLKPTSLTLNPQHQNFPTSTKRKFEEAEGLLTVAPRKYQKVEIVENSGKFGKSENPNKFLSTGSAFKRVEKFANPCNTLKIYESISSDEDDEEENFPQENPKKEKSETFARDENRDDSMWRPW